MTEKRANLLIEVIGESLVKLKGINFVAVREENDEFYLEIGYNSNKIKFPKTIVSNPNHLLFQNPLLNPCISNELLSFVSNDTDAFLAKTVDTKSDFTFQDNILKPGNSICRLGNKLKPGTLGMFLKMKSCDDVFLISNHHVVMGNLTKLNKMIINESNEEEIGTLFWGLFNDYYDVGIVKLNDNISKNFQPPCFNFSGQIINPIINMNIGLAGKSSGCLVEKNRKILSTNAFVCINDDKIFKNQILSDKISERGDSGAILINTKNNDAIGLIMAGDDMQYSISNYLSPLFCQEIKEIPYLYKENDTIKIGQMPKFEIESILI